VFNFREESPGLRLGASFHTNKSPERERGDFGFLSYK